ncbi:TPA: ead/Ea22-like family protein [Salmonella enterica subsp. enterica serovar Virchow]
MSNIDKQALREEFRFMQVHYSDPADRARQVIYIAAEALLDELEHYKSREERVTKLVLDNSTSWDALYKKLEAAEKLNAEQQRSLEHCKFLLLSAYEVQRDFAEALGCTGDNESIMEAIDAMKQRIAELEARTVNLPKRSVGEVMCLSGFSLDYAEGWCAGNDNAIHEIRAAGIKVKGE